MGIFFGGLGAVLAAAPTWWLLQMATTNLASSYRVSLLIAVTIVAAVIGLLVGGAIGGRIGRGATGLPVFAALAGGIGGGMLGAILVATISAAYLISYGEWPGTLLGQILYVLAVPAFAAVGWFAGMAVGATTGFVSGALLRFLPVGAR